MANNSFSGTLNSPIELKGILSSPDELKGLLSSPDNLTGKLSNVTLRGMPVELHVTDTTLQWKYEDEDEWRDLIDLNDIDYEKLNNLPTIDGKVIMREMEEDIITPKDALTNMEIERLLR